MIPADLLEILRCPQTRQPLLVAGTELLAAANRRLRERGGEVLDAALARADGTAVYPVRGGIPILLVEEAVLL